MNVRNVVIVLSEYSFCICNFTSAKQGCATTALCLVMYALKCCCTRWEACCDVHEYLAQWCHEFQYF